MIFPYLFPFPLMLFFLFVYDFDSGPGTSISRNATLQQKQAKCGRISKLLSVLMIMV